MEGGVDAFAAFLLKATPSRDRRIDFLTGFTARDGRGNKGNRDAWAYSRFCGMIIGVKYDGIIAITIVTVVK